MSGLDLSVGVRMAIAKSGLERRLFAERAGIAPGLLSRYSTGEIAPGARNLERIARAAGLPAWQIVRWSEEGAG